MGYLLHLNEFHHIRFGQTNMSIITIAIGGILLTIEYAAGTRDRLLL